jgi:membrane dipeptidase
MNKRIAIVICASLLSTAVTAQDQGAANDNLAGELFGMGESRELNPEKTILDMRPRPTEEADFPEFIEYLVEIAEPRTAEERAGDKEIMDRYPDAIVMDSLFVGAPGFPAGITPETYEEGIQHNIDNRYNFISATITNQAPEDTPEVVKQRMRDTNAYWAAQPDRYVQVREIQDILDAKAAGKTAMMHNFQGMLPLGSNNDPEESIANLREYHDLGLRQLMATYNVDSIYADGGLSNSDGTDKGITELGAAVIREANELGIIVDCSHSSNQTCITMARATRKPMMLSHSNLTTYQAIDRNSSDDAVKAVAGTGGVICVNFIGGFLNPQGLARPYDIAKHAHYIKNLVGAQAVCAGSDYVWNYADTLLWILRSPEQFPVEMGYATPSHMGKPGEIWGVARELEETFGWTEKEIRGFLGENLMRVYSANFK